MKYIISLFATCLVYSVTPALADLIVSENSFAVKITIHESPFVPGPETFTLLGEFWDVTIAINKIIDPSFRLTCETTTRDAEQCLGTPPKPPRFVTLDAVSGLVTVQLKHFLDPVSGVDIPAPILSQGFGGSGCFMCLLTPPMPAFSTNNNFAVPHAHGSEVLVTNYSAAMSNDGSLFRIDDWKVLIVGAHIPEPATWLLLGSGLVGLIMWRKRTA